MTAVYDPETTVAVAQTAPYNSSGLVWAVAKLGPFETKAAAREAAKRMLAAEAGEAGGA